MRKSFAAALILLGSGAAADTPPMLGLPADCTLGETCFIQQYVDFDPGPGASDFMCEGLSYDGHRGTDFGLPSMRAMRAGVPVIASAPGRVRGIRDGMADRLYTDDMAAELEGKDCGNGVAIRHEGGWETQYCHLRQGSVRVEAGQQVGRGDVLGLIGLSGRTQFPHVHLTLRREGEVVDPFDPDGQITCGAPSRETLWLDAPEYRPGGLLSAGFSTAVPSFDDIKEGIAGRSDLAPDAPALVAWGYAFGGRAGDVMEISIMGPAGEVFSHTATIDKAQAQFFRAAGRRAPSGGWEAGSYSAEISLLRNGAVVDSMTTPLTIR